MRSKKYCVIFSIVCLCRLIAIALVPKVVRPLRSKAVALVELDLKEDSNFLRANGVGYSTVAAADNGRKQWIEDRFGYWRKTFL